MRKIIVFVFSVFVLISCGRKEKPTVVGIEKEQVASNLLRLSYVPVVESLPIVVADANGMFGAADVDIDIAVKKSMMECDELFTKGRSNMFYTDVIRARHLSSKGVDNKMIHTFEVRYSLIGCRQARLNNISQLTDKMMGMTRYSVSDSLCGSTSAFRIQVNDPLIRMNMLNSHEIDAAWFVEPWQSWAISCGGNEIRLPESMTATGKGAIAVAPKILNDKKSREELNKFVKVYNQAVDSIEKNGVGQYIRLLDRYIACPDSVYSRVKPRHFSHIKPL